jgi:hypothetical protein
MKLNVLKQRFLRFVTLLGTFFMLQLFALPVQAQHDMSRCIQLNPKGNLDCLFEPNYTTPLVWSAGNLFGSGYQASEQSLIDAILAGIEVAKAGNSCGSLFVRWNPVPDNYSSSPRVLTSKWQTHMFRGQAIFDSCLLNVPPGSLDPFWLIAHGGGFAIDIYAGSAVCLPRSILHNIEYRRKYT